jgi:hypothetical protein
MRQIVMNEKSNKLILSEVNMSHKTTSILILLLALAGMSGAANLVVNGDFEISTGTGWTQWWGGDSNRYVGDPVPDPGYGDHCAGVWWYTDGIFQDIAVGPGIYEFGGKLMTTQGMVNRNGVIRADVGDATNVWWSQDLAIVPGDATYTWYSYSGVIDNTVAGATRIRMNLMMANLVNPGSGIVYYDDVYLGPLGISDQAKFPHPTIGELVAPATDLIRWIKPDPNNPADTITCDVFFGTTNPPVTQIADNITASSITLSALVPPVTLLPGTQYFWRVNCTDPNSDGNPATTLGDVWTFSTRNDNPPVVDAGANKYLWINMNDGDGDPTKVTFMLDGTLTDDNQSPVTLLWTLIYSEQAPETVVTITNPAAVDTTCTITGTGFYRFQLHAQDAYAEALDTVEVIVYGSACEAAKGDPGDIPANYPGGIGDLDNDCDVDLDDLAITAATWLDCLSAKLGCTP